ncbi:Hsp33 family molecular chaperone HslO [Colwellia sp. 1_MG-2023]|uniref:Hsp33 family molecular chaperone HslO n=1 Tax=Colwellia sp. 1_MG-2023 TaxID=3062649 RepID=UPI0026E27F91|nr:Hsp33 family molecular chaperone HslO [Colwellia sp. 1_MG-2023]MDO6447427.1 Hsp33 family molecular chaperone HslO [Colwellia sp. 1_MG-2023]
MNTQPDILHRYLFDDLHVRGELVQLSDTYQQIIAAHDYPLGVRQLLGELVAATCLLTATLKLEGEISVQLQGDGPIGYLAVNGGHNQKMRGIAKLKETTAAQGLQNLIGKGTMVITIHPVKGEAYQGVVALEQSTIADCLSHYFKVSEQIPTMIWLYHNDETQQVAGSLVQLLPDGGDKEKQHNDFEHLCQLTNTLKAEEIFTLDAETLLFRLYNQEKVRLFDPQEVTYQCSCSEEKCMNAISQFQATEIQNILAEQGSISMTCDYCLTTYAFYEKQLQHLLNDVQH